MNTSIDITIDPSPDLLDVDSLQDPRSLSRRSSLRASITSVDFSKTEFQLDEIPSTDIELEDFTKALCLHYKRKYHLQEILTHSWIGDDPNAVNSDRNSLLHCASKLGETKLVTVLVIHFKANLDSQNIDGNTALHLSVENGHAAITDILVKNNCDLEISNEIGLTPIQIAALKCQGPILEILFKHHADHTVMTSNQETILHLACYATLSKILAVKDELKSQLEKEPTEDMCNTCQTIEDRANFREKEIQNEAFPCLKLILEKFEKCPDLLDIEDTLATSPGGILHYFSCLNYVHGVEILVKDPFFLNTNILNKNQLSPLWIASWHNRTILARLLLDHGADPNVQDPQVKYSPLHCAILGYHMNRSDETCDFIESLLEHGANPRIMDRSGETAPHLSIGTLDFRIMSKFIEHLGPEVQEIRDESGNTLLHYAVGYLDEQSIHSLIIKGANLMSYNFTEEIIEDKSDYNIDQLGLQVINLDASRAGWINHGTSESVIKRQKSIPIQRIPLQEAMKNGNSLAYFNALRRLDIQEILDQMDKTESKQFLCMHLVAATREVRPDIVRILFNHITEDLHEILLFKEDYNEDDTFRKTALEWAVENNDRLCTTEILHQEYECHQDDRKEGLQCLRQQLTGDELLVWTIETFTMFYSRTWAQSVILPLLGLIPLLLSIASFVYDYYSDAELTIEYYQNAFINGNSNDSIQLEMPNGIQYEDCIHQYNSSHILLNSNLLHNCSKYFKNVKKDPHHLDFSKINLVTENQCSPIKRDPAEYRTAFIVNIICITWPYFIFWTMCSRELWSHMQGHVILKILFWPLSILCAPFFIIYIAFKQVIYKFLHKRAKRKNKYREQLQQSEYFWGISRTAEAALESCGQLILQIWLLSSDFDSLRNDSASELVDKSYDGIVFFLSFGAKNATDIEKSLGKMVMSLIALVCGVAASYRTLKRGAVKLSNTLFIYFSLTCQIFARILSLGIFFFTARNFLPTVPILLGIHFMIVGLLKWTFERARHTQGKMAQLVALVNVFASSLVYVRIVPIEKKLNFKQMKRLQKQKLASNNATAQQTEQHSTFFIQTLFFLVVFVENIILASWPLIKGPPNRALNCLGSESIWNLITIIFGLCFCSWTFHILYYKYMGHPWTEINGPNCTRYGLRFNFHLCGKEQYLLCQCCQPGEEKYFKVRKTDSPDNLTNIGGDAQIIDNGKMTSDIIDV